MNEPEVPKAGEDWKWMWLTVTVLKAGPKRVTYRTLDGEHISVPTVRFLDRFQRIGLGEAS